MGSVKIPTSIESRDESQKSQSCHELYMHVPMTIGSYWLVVGDRFSLAIALIL